MATDPQRIYPGADPAHVHMYVDGRCSGCGTEDPEWPAMGTPSTEPVPPEERPSGEIPGELGPKAGLSSKVR